MGETRSAPGEVTAQTGQADFPDHTGWSDSSARAVLQLMAESVAEMIGFEVVSLSVVLDGMLLGVAYTGPAEFRGAVMDTDEPVEILQPVIEQAVVWGHFRFLAAEMYDESVLSDAWITVVEEQADLPDAWHPADILIAPLHDEAGEMIGLLSVDSPVSGRRPDAAQRSLLERYAAQAERAVQTAFEREELLGQISRAETARSLVRAAAMTVQSSLDAVLDQTHRPLLEGFEAGGSWIHVFESAGSGRGFARGAGGESVEIPEEARELSREIAQKLWSEQRVLELTGSAVEEPPLPAPPFDLHDEIQAIVEALELDRVLVVPLGAGMEAVGVLVLTRNVAHRPWTSVEIRAALEIGHDLGAALMTARALERERNLVRELQQLDDYRTQLIATLSHELRTPLTVIAGNLELLGGLELDPMASRFHAAMTRGTDRMQKVVSDLLLLAQVSDPQHPVAYEPVDLGAVARDLVSLVESEATKKGLRIEVDLGPDLVVPGDAAELDRLLSNLLSNAVKYNRGGGRVTITGVRRESDEGTEVVMTVADDGLGISEEDQRTLFRPFFRTTNPEALEQPGTGLGLAIVATTVERHRGRVEVSSKLDEGTTFVITLPAWRES